MTLLDNLNHIAIATADLEAFVAFYVEVFEVEVLFREETPHFRHAILRCGGNSWLHPIEILQPVGGAAAAGKAGVDHMALAAASAEGFETLRARLRQRGASDGQVCDLGAFHSFWFKDPDGTKVEVTLIVDTLLRHFHAPVPIGVAA